MVFLYEEKAGEEFIVLKGESYKYLVKVRRHKIGDTLALRQKTNPKLLHTYTITEIEPRSLSLKKVHSQHYEVKAKKSLHVGWCVIDSKSVEKVLASLNEIGVGGISFIYCERSQKNFKADFKRYERIIEASNQQCGRSDIMEFKVYKNLKIFLEDYPNVKVFDFTQKVLDTTQNINNILIGCEGGFSAEEKILLAQKDVFRLDTPLVLRSESAVLAVSAKILL
jgi:16S rRNA (uracil1498-N3)-methyltransferase